MWTLLEIFLWRSQKWMQLSRLIINKRKCNKKRIINCEELRGTKYLFLFYKFWRAKNLWKWRYNNMQDVPTYLLHSAQTRRWPLMQILGSFFVGKKRWKKLRLKIRFIVKNQRKSSSWKQVKACAICCLKKSWKNKS